MCRFSNMLLNWLFRSSALPAVPVARTILLWGGRHAGCRAEADVGQFEYQRRKEGGSGMITLFGVAVV